MEDLERRGGEIDAAGSKKAISARWSPASISSWSRPSKGPLGQLFTYRPEHTPFTQPQRRLFVGLYRGVTSRSDERDAVGFSRPRRDDRDSHLDVAVSRTALLMKNIAGRRFPSTLMALSYEKDRRRFLKTVLATLKSTTRRHTTASTRRGSISPSRRTCCKASCRQCATPSPNLTGKMRHRARRRPFRRRPFDGPGRQRCVLCGIRARRGNRQFRRAGCPLCRKGRSAPPGSVLGASRWTNVMLRPPSESLHANRHDEPQ